MLPTKPSRWLHLVSASALLAGVGCSQLPLAPNTMGGAAETTTQATPEEQASNPPVGSPSEAALALSAAQRTNAPDSNAAIEAQADAEATASSEDASVQEELSQLDQDVAAETSEPDDSYIPDHADLPDTEGPDLWPRLRTGFRLPNKDHPSVQAHINWYLNHTDYLDRTFTRAQPFLYYIMQQVEARNMPLEIALLPVVESAFRPFAYSHSRASGIWQFIPETARRYGINISWWYDGRRDVVAATQAALDYLDDLQKRYNGDWNLALAAYNCGEGNVDKAIERNTRSRKPTDFWSLRLPRETRGYVPRLLAISAIVADPEKYGIIFNRIPDKPFLAVVDPGRQIDVAIAADLSGLTIEDMHRLNAGINRWATDPKGPHRLLVPIAHAEALQGGLAQIPADDYVKWEKHTVAKSDNLAKIATAYHTTPDVVRQANGMNSNYVRAGQQLTIPVAQQSLDRYVLSVDQRLVAGLGDDGGKRNITHTVKSGETLWSISRRYRVPMKQLASWNQMGTRDTLRIGQKLTIRKSGAPAMASGESAQRTVNYIVKKGDSLTRIAKRFNVKVADLQEWNPNTSKHHILPGQQIKVHLSGSSSGSDAGESS